MSQPVDEGNDVLGMGGLSLSDLKARKREQAKERQLAEWAELAAGMAAGAPCRVEANAATVRFLGCDLEDLPGGWWVGVEYDRPVGKNDGTVKGRRLWTCPPGTGHLLRPDKISLAPMTPNFSKSDPLISSTARKRLHERWAEVDPADVIGSHPSVEDTSPRYRVGLVYDRRMEAHISPTFHPEQPARIAAIFGLLADQGLAHRCFRVPARTATKGELESVHAAEHIQNMASLASLPPEQVSEMAANMDSIFLCPKSGDSALLAAGSVIEATRRVCTKNLARAACAVRPPGHHAMPGCATGFCLFGNVGVAAKEALNNGWAKRVLVFDFDVHHGNGTQKMFLESDQVLFVSVHRYDKGTFYPGGPNASPECTGVGAGKGHSVNIAWPKGGAGDPEYILAVEQVVMPIAREYAPDLILISAGFDAAAGDPLGGCALTPRGYHAMVAALMQLAGGRIVLALEGGYSLGATARCFAACVGALLNDPPPPPPETLAGAAPTKEAVAGAPFAEAIATTAAIHSRFWKALKHHAPPGPTASPAAPAVLAGTPAADLKAPPSVTLGSDHPSPWGGGRTWSPAGREGGSPLVALGTPGTVPRQLDSAFKKRAGQAVEAD